MFKLHVCLMCIFLICTTGESEVDDQMYNNRALLYIIRDYCPDISTKCNLMIDDENVGKFGRMEFMRVFLLPGKHSIDAVWPLWSKGYATEYEDEFIAGKTYYIILINQEPSLSITKLIPGIIRGGGCKFIPTKGYTESSLIGYGYKQAK